RRRGGARGDASLVAGEARPPPRPRPSRDGRGAQGGEARPAHARAEVPGLRGGQGPRIEVLRAQEEARLKREEATVFIPCFSVFFLRDEPLIDERALDHGDRSRVALGRRVLLVGKVGVLPLLREVPERLEERDARHPGRPAGTGRLLLEVALRSDAEGLRLERPRDDDELGADLGRVLAHEADLPDLLLPEVGEGVAVALEERVVAAVEARPRREEGAAERLQLLDRGEDRARAPEGAPQGRAALVLDRGGRGLGVVTHRQEVV